MRVRLGHLAPFLLLAACASSDGDDATGGAAAGGAGTGDGGSGGTRDESGGAGAPAGGARTGGSSPGGSPDGGAQATGGAGGAPTGGAPTGGAAGGDATGGGGGGASTGGSDGGAATGGASTGGAGGGAESCPADGGAGAVRVRVVAGNITSGNYQSYDPGEGIRIFQALAPDIALVQELRFGDYSEAAAREFVDLAFGEDFVFYREPMASNGDLPNGVVSRYPIDESGVWEDGDAADNREFAWARIDVPGPADLWAVSVHFKANDGASDIARRTAQATTLVGLLDDHVPDGDLIVVGGDLNAQDTSEPCLAVLAGALSLDTIPVDQADNRFTNTSRTKPYDWVLPSPALEACAAPLTIGESTFPTGLVFDSRVYSPLEEVAPVEAGDSGVEGMQHMAVARDFWFPSD